MTPNGWGKKVSNLDDGNGVGVRADVIVVAVAAAVVLDVVAGH